MSRTLAEEVAVLKDEVRTLSRTLATVKKQLKAVGTVAVCCAVYIGFYG